MPVPKGKSSKSRRDRRTANVQATVLSISSCQTCQADVLPHQVCFECGYYKGEKVIRTKTDRMHDRGQARREKEEKSQLGQEELPKPEQAPTKDS